MFYISHPSEHLEVARNNRHFHRILPSFGLFPRIFNPGFLGRAPTRSGSREEGILQSRTGFPRCRDMDRYRRLHLA